MISDHFQTSWQWGDFQFSFSQLKSWIYLQRLGLPSLSSSFQWRCLSGYYSWYGAKVTLLQSSIMALLVTKMLNLLSKVLWIRNWWQLRSKVHPVQLSTNTVDFVTAQLMWQFFKFFRKRIQVRQKRAICEFQQLTILQEPPSGHSFADTVIFSLFLLSIPDIWADCDSTALNSCNFSTSLTPKSSSLLENLNFFFGYSFFFNYNKLE